MGIGWDDLETRPLAAATVVSAKWERPLRTSEVPGRDLNVSVV